MKMRQLLKKKLNDDRQRIFPRTCKTHPTHLQVIFSIGLRSRFIYSKMSKIYCFSILSRENVMGRKKKIISWPY